THSWIHLSIGRVDRWLRWGLVEASVTGMLFVLGLHWGPAGVAAASSLSFVTLTLPALWYAGRPIGLDVYPMITAIWKFVLASALAACGTAIVLGVPVSVAPPDVIEAVVRIGKTVALFVVLYLAVVIAVHASL